MAIKVLKEYKQRTEFTYLGSCVDRQKIRFDLSVTLNLFVTATGSSLNVSKWNRSSSGRRDVVSRGSCPCRDYGVGDGLRPAHCRRDGDRHGPPRGDEIRSLYFAGAHCRADVHDDRALTAVSPRNRRRGFGARRCVSIPDLLFCGRPTGCRGVVTNRSPRRRCYEEETTCRWCPVCNRQHQRLQHRWTFLPPFHRFRSSFPSTRIKTMLEATDFPFGALTLSVG